MADRTAALQRAIIVVGTARANGNTAFAAQRLLSNLGLDVAILDLASLELDGFRYGGTADRDGFKDAIREVLKYRHVVFATPVYWYAMSGVLKAFVDRLTDLLQEPNKELGRELAGRDAWLLATGTDPRLPAGFTAPFALTAGYFGLRWRRGYYVRSIQGALPTERELAKVSAMASELI
jgi:multimeric flavodoxin WrbA